jgi:hypothetical protein
MAIPMVRPYKSYVSLLTTFNTFLRFNANLVNSIRLFQLSDALHSYFSAQKQLIYLQNSTHTFEVYYSLSFFPDQRRLMIHHLSSFINICNLGKYIRYITPEEILMVAIVSGIQIMQLRFTDRYYTLGDSRLFQINKR